MCIRHRPDDPENDTIAEVCKDVTDLDIGSNLFETIAEVYDLCHRLPKLRNLTLDGNRLSTPDEYVVLALQDVKTLSLSNTLLRWETELVQLLRRLSPALQTLVANNNEWRAISQGTLPKGLRVLEVSDNEFDALEVVGCEAGSSVETLVLKNCNISTVSIDGGPTKHVFDSIRELDIRHNTVTDWSFFNDLAVSMSNLKHLRTTGNPLYQNLHSADGKMLTAEDGYMLTIARLPGLETLNYSKITDKERLNAETYYLNQIALELSLSSATSDEEWEKILTKHPRWTALCEEYGEPAIARPAKKEDVDPNSLAARLVTIHFVAGTQIWSEDIPRSLNIYSLLGLVGKRLSIMPLKLRLFLETGERDPLVQIEEYGAPEWWCSSDDESDDGSGRGRGEEEWVTRDVELVAGTRAVGTYVEGKEARVRVEVRR